LRSLNAFRAEVFRRLDTAPAGAPLDLRAFNSLLFGLQTASANSKRTRFDSSLCRQEMVTDLSPAEPKPPQRVEPDGSDPL
jgi:hypothetical protein